MNFIDRLLDVMQERNVSIYRLSKDLGISNSLISKWQRNPNIEPSAKTVLSISEYFHIDMKWLLTGIGNQNKTIDVEPVNNEVISTSPDEHAIGQLSLEEKLLIENYRDMKEKDKIDVQRNIARKLSKDERIKSTTCPNTKGDMEIAEDIS